MKKILVFIAFLIIAITLNGQAPASFKYQAVIRDSRGNPKANTATTVNIDILQGTATGNAVYSESHRTTTDASGVINLDLGMGTASLGTLAGINWGSGTYFIKITIDGIAMGTSQLLSVPYALYANKAANGFSGSYSDLTNKPDLANITTKKITVAGETTDVEEALFEVKNKSGQTVFAVYNEGVRIYVSDGVAKGAKGGFAIGGFGGAKAVPQDYLVVNPDMIRMYIDDSPGKGAKGGFAIGGFGGAKAGPNNLLIVNPDSIRAYIDSGTGKGAKGGFAIGGYGHAKGSGEEYLRVTRDSTRVYINNTPSKASKGGFAIGGFGNAKGGKNDYLLISPDSTNFYVRQLSDDASSTFNILSVGQNNVQKSLMKANTDTIDMASVLNLQNNFNVYGNIGYTGAVTQIVVPVLTTTSVLNVTATTASSGGNITSDGGAVVIVSGVCWGTTESPTIKTNPFTTDGSLTGTYASSVTGLSPNTTYYIRAYATNSAGTAYGNELSFTTGTVPTVPVLTTTPLSAITQTSVSGGGEIMSDGGATVTDRGICWGTTTNPTITDNRTTDGTGQGLFSSAVTGLTANTTYYVRAYAINSVGVAYGSEISFNTLAVVASVTDYDGNIYSTVTIGTQTWMAENLKTTSFSDGTSITNISDGPSWSYLSTPAYCWYNNDAATNKAVYGALYNWFTVDALSNGGKNLCPTGWHAPSDAEWTTLTAYLGDEPVAGGKLKEAGITHWNSPNSGATNETGFIALPGGMRDFSGNYSSILDNGFWWSSTEYAAQAGWNRTMTANSASAAKGPGNKLFGLSVRCLQGAPLASVPVLFTMPAASITETTAIVGSDVMSDGGAPVTVRGVCWSTTPGPTIANNRTTDGTGTGPLQSTLTGLTASTTYYVRAYATNSAGTGYGSEEVFTTAITP